MVSIFFWCILFILDHKETLHQHDSIVALVLLAIIALLFIPIIGLTGFHIILVARGRTTNEQVTGKFQGGYNPFSRGCWSNCCYTLCGLIQLDSHITHITKKETAFTQIMGHLDVISFIGDIFNVYLPLCICLLCLSTFFEFGAKVLHNLGFEQFILTDEMTAELIREGQELVKREKNKALRHLEHNSSQTPRIRKPVEEQQPLSTTKHMNTRSSPDDRQELINEVEPIGYSTNTWNYDSTSRPQKGLFDDI
ncbi:unnamed protein product [Medioppia subpectinata]|uniref:Palmitoyltransferase n=1 Tax=Medioppia subpectinata TaxID=1979941 RepID=A0A7R9KNL7_9ACAR|nr:unnamed protein product [Medioppia subpectinata]CAG2105744.1 unnamed protein product [Medioppia subpectinata]